MPIPFWSEPLESLLDRLHTSREGLTSAEAAGRNESLHATRLKPGVDLQPFRFFFSQLRNPIVLILLGAAAISFFLSDRTDAAIILAIVLVSALLGFWQEYGAAHVVAKLLALVHVTTDVRRDGRIIEIPLERVVPGDVVELSAGSTLPGDARLLEAKDLFVDETVLTGEAYPVEKTVGAIAASSALPDRTNSLFLGTHIVSGRATALVVSVGTETEFGRIAHRLRMRAPETEFERGVRRFGYLLLEVTLLLVLGIFAVNVYLERPVLEAFLFAMALAVGLTPQLLPAIISVNLAHGAKRMAHEKVVVKRLESIENFGSMSVLCSDKTGTLTEGVMRLHGAFNVAGTASESVLLLGTVNASFETGFPNPLDDALRRGCRLDLSGFSKLDEEPYDFLRKRLSVLVRTPKTHLLITKGAVPRVLDVCSHAESGESLVPIERVRSIIVDQVQAWNRQGFRTIALASRDMGSVGQISREHETGMTFLGLLVFADPAKPRIGETIAQLLELGVSLKVITGDHALVAKHVGLQVGLADPQVMTGAELNAMNEGALRSQVNRIDIFAEIEPNQKERIVRSLRAAGHVVGYIGDGINDAPALHAADVGISVDSAVDIAKEAADLVLLEPGLEVLVKGVREGRNTFANTLKYVFMATSANFGNMFSMAGASLFLPFLPLLPKQILLTNLLTDIPEMTIATDRVDQELIERPRRWDIPFIRRFMLTFGLVSSVFDVLTFATLWLLLGTTIGQFRTGWFIESVISASLIVLVIRTRRPFVTSRPSTALLVTTLAVGMVTLLLPLTSVGQVLGFEPVPPSCLLALTFIILAYVLTAEFVKRRFYAAAESPARRR